MAYVVTESCIRCKYMDCIVACPVNCFREGENMLVIDQETCIDCAACEPVCPVDAIVSDAVPGAAPWVELNREYAALWPMIVEKGDVPKDADTFRTVNEKRAMLSAKPAMRS